MSGIKYNVTGQRTQINYGNGTGTSYEYDERNHRLKRLETRNAKSILQTIEYEYDDTGNVTERESEMLGTDGRMKRAVHEYEYDSSGRLTEGSGKVEKTTAGILRPNIVSYKSKYSYDAIGNILTKTQAVNGGESSLSCNDTYTYGGKQPHAVTKAGAMVFTYDDNGNMIKRENTETKNTMTLVWDDENRLIKTTDSLHTTDYRYDANGERIIKKSELGETQYVSANYIVRNKTVISKHIFAGNQRVASTVSMKDNCGTVSEKNTMYFHPDHLGSSSYVMDKKGNFFEMIEYLPYGETLYDEAATVDKTEFRFTSKEMDAETGLYYYGARYYDAKLCKFVSSDDRIDGLFSSAGQNMYMYCHGNPINMVDPDGHAKVDSATRWRLSNVMDRTNYPDLQVDPGEGYKDNIEAKVQASVKSNSDNIAAEKKAIAEKQQHQQENSTRVIKRLMYGLSSNGGSFRYDESVRAITSDFGWRIHPTRGGESFHGGQDLIFGDGWVRAQMDGTASKVDRMGGYGQALIVDSGPIDGTPGSPRMTQLYGHFDEFMAPNGKIMPLIFVKPGDKVQRGDIIGIQGMTGTATGPHCHFEIRIGGVAVDPFVMPRADTMSTWGP